MANIKSQKKRIKTNEKARLRNRSVRSELKTATRAVQDAVAAGNGAEAYAAALAACRLMDKAVSKGVIHKRQAANRKSGIMLLANTVVIPEDIAAYKPVEKKKAEVKGGAKKASRESREEEGSRGCCKGEGEASRRDREGPEGRREEEGRSRSCGCRESSEEAAE